MEEKSAHLTLGHRWEYKLQMKMCRMAKWKESQQFVLALDTTAECKI